MKRTQIICLHEGRPNSVDRSFVNSFLKAYSAKWMRPWTLVPCGDKTRLLERFPKELKICGSRGGNTTLIVMADVDDCKDSDALKAKYRKAAQAEGISQDLFDQVVFAFPKDRIENWVQYIKTGTTDENVEGPRVKNPGAATAAKKLADICKSGSDNSSFPPSLKWSCISWSNMTRRVRD